MASRCGG